MLCQADSKMALNDLCLLVFIPLYKPFLFSVTWPSALLPINRILQKWWDAISDIRLQQDYNFHLVHSLILSSGSFWRKPAAMLWATPWIDPCRKALMSLSKSQWGPESCQQPRRGAWCLPMLDLQMSQPLLTPWLQPWEGPWARDSQRSHLDS